MPLVGFLLDTTLAAAHLVFSGVVERFPRIRWVLGHLGGAIPYLAERLDRGYEAVNLDPAALRLAIAFAGPSQILAGSDYPHRIGSIPAMLGSLRGLDVSEQDRAAMLGGNAARLLGS